MRGSTEIPFLKPSYGSEGFASLPSRLLEILNSRHYDSVILLIMDGFGWRFVEQFQHEPFLDWVTRNGTIEKLTSQFPSTTSAHITTIHTGQPVGEHGVYEWNYYEPGLDAVITPMLFSFAGTMQRDTLQQAGVSPSSIYPRRTIYGKFSNQGVKASIYQPREYNPSTYSNAMCKGAKIHGYRTFSEGLTSLLKEMANSTSRKYFHLYHEKIDTLGHQYGPNALQTHAEIHSFLSTMEYVIERWNRFSGKSLFMLTADHGLVEVDPGTTIYLNTDQRFSGLLDFLRTDRSGRPIVPGGSCRDFFLYIKPGMVEEAQQFLASRLEGKAEVREVADMISAGWFGTRITTAFKNRVGDLVILPYRGESVWWYEKDRFFQGYYGHHGGLTPEEMEIPLILWEM